MRATRQPLFSTKTEKASVICSLQGSALYFVHIYVCMRLRAMVCEKKTFVYV